MIKIGKNKTMMKTGKTGMMMKKGKPLYQNVNFPSIIPSTKKGVGGNISKMLNGFPSMFPKKTKIPRSRNVNQKMFLGKTKGNFLARITDSDKDGVINGMDCFFMNKKKHDDDQLGIEVIEDDESELEQKVEDETEVVDLEKQYEDSQDEFQKGFEKVKEQVNEPETVNELETVRAKKPTIQTYDVEGYDEDSEEYYQKDVKEYSPRLEKAKEIARSFKPSNIKQKYKVASKNVEERKKDIENQGFLYRNLTSGGLQKARKNILEKTKQEALMKDVGITKTGNVYVPQGLSVKQKTQYIKNKLSENTRIKDREARTERFEKYKRLGELSILKAKKKKSYEDMRTAKEKRTRQYYEGKDRSYGMNTILKGQLSSSKLFNNVEDSGSSEGNNLGGFFIGKNRNNYKNKKQEKGVKFNFGDLL